MGSANLRSDRLRAQLAVNVKKLCSTLQISENELARRSGVSQKQVNNIVNERTGCGIDALDAIAHVGSVAPWLLLSPMYKAHAAQSMRVERVFDTYSKLDYSQREAIDTLVLRGM